MNDMTKKTSREKTGVQRKSSLLGQPQGTAANRLKKNVMFMLAQKCGMDTCFQCGKTILDSDSLSVDHKIPWQLSENPIDLFFDIENIAFSHLSCNSGAAKRLNKKYFDKESLIAARKSYNAEFSANPERRAVWNANRREKRSKDRLLKNDGG